MGERASADRTFRGSIPDVYERLMVPMLFRDYALDLAQRIAPHRPARILELAAGTGILTRALVDALPDATIVSTDVSPPMVDRASATVASSNVEWRVADATELPFADGTFDAVVCQFGIMFFPDRVRAAREARRVLSPDGRFVFNTWDRTGLNPIPMILGAAVDRLFEHGASRFMDRLPHGYHNRDAIRNDLAAAGFDAPAHLQRVVLMSRAADAHEAARAFCFGSPLLNLLTEAGIDPQAATELGASMLTDRFGDGPIAAPMAALVVTAER